jgi:hypothetical protein
MSIVTILMNLLQHETEKYMFIETYNFQRHSPRTVHATKDYPRPAVVWRVDAAFEIVLFAASRPVYGRRLASRLTGGRWFTPIAPGVWNVLGVIRHGASRGSGTLG